MNLYQFENKEQDYLFLSGAPVKCRAVMTASPVVGDPILIVLSNGKKYKGKIIAFNFFTVKDYLAGDLEIIRAS